MLYIPRRLTYEYVKGYIESFDGYKLISKVYKNSLEKLKLQYLDEEPFYISFSAFKNGGRGKAHKRKIQKNLFTLSYEEVCHRISKEGFTLLSSEYKGNKQKLKIRNNSTNEIIYTNLNSFQLGHRTNRNKKKTYDMVKKDIESVNGYKLLSKKYTGSKEKLLIQYNDNEPFLMSYNAFVNGQRDPSLCKNKRKTYKEVKEYFKKEGYLLISEKYINQSTPLMVRSPEGEEFYICYKSFKKGIRFRKNKSVGEKKISSFLFENNIEFIPQYSVHINNCRHLFDFFIPNKNVYIEYDGIQHFKPIDFFGGEEALRKRKLRDNQKNNWCEENNAKLIRIKYAQQSNIENIIKKELIS